MLVKCATEVARLFGVSIQSCTQNQLCPKSQSLLQDFNRLNDLRGIWHTCSAWSWLQNCASDILIFPTDFVVVFQGQKEG